MMFVVDTCGWIEWLTDGKLGSEFGKYLLSPKQLVVPVLIQYELFKWVRRERDEATAYNIVALTQKGHVMPVDTSLALLAADVSAQHQLAMADAFVFATALQSNAQVVTSDKHFAALPGVKYFSKK